MAERKKVTLGQALRMQRTTRLALEGAPAALKSLMSGLTWLDQKVIAAEHVADFAYLASLGLVSRQSQSELWQKWADTREVKTFYRKNLYFVRDGLAVIIGWKNATIETAALSRLGSLNLVDTLADKAILSHVLDNWERSKVESSQLLVAHPDISEFALGIADPVNALAFGLIENAGVSFLKKVKEIPDLLPVAYALKEFPEDTAWILWGQTSQGPAQVTIEALAHDARNLSEPALALRMWSAGLRAKDFGGWMRSASRRTVFENKAPFVKALIPEEGFNPIIQGHPFDEFFFQELNRTSSGDFLEKKFERIKKALLDKPSTKVDSPLGKLFKAYRDYWHEVRKLPMSSYFQSWIIPKNFRDAYGSLNDVDKIAVGKALQSYQSSASWISDLQSNRMAPLWTQERQIVFDYLRDSFGPMDFASQVARSAGVRASKIEAKLLQDTIKSYQKINPKFADSLRRGNIPLYRENYLSLAPRKAPSTPKLVVEELEEMFDKTLGYQRQQSGQVPATATIVDEAVFGLLTREAPVPERVNQLVGNVRRVMDKIEKNEPPWELLSPMEKSQALLGMRLILKRYESPLFQGMVKTAKGKRLLQASLDSWDSLLSSARRLRLLPSVAWKIQNVMEDFMKSFARLGPDATRAFRKSNPVRDTSLLGKELSAPPVSMRRLAQVEESTSKQSLDWSERWMNAIRTRVYRSTYWDRVEEMQKSGWTDIRAMDAQAILSAEKANTQIFFDMDTTPAAMDTLSRIGFMFPKWYWANFNFAINVIQEYPAYGLKFFSNVVAPAYDSEFGADGNVAFTLGNGVRLSMPIQNLAPQAKMFRALENVGKAAAIEGTPQARADSVYRALRSTLSSNPLVDSLSAFAGPENFRASIVVPMAGSLQVVLPEVAGVLGNQSKAMADVIKFLTPKDMESRDTFLESERRAQRLLRLYPSMDARRAIEISRNQVLFEGILSTLWINGKLHDPATLPASLRFDRTEALTPSSKAIEIRQNPEFQGAISSVSDDDTKEFIRLSNDAKEAAKTVVDWGKEKWDSFINSFMEGSNVGNVLFGVLSGNAEAAQPVTEANSQKPSSQNLKAADNKTIMVPAVSAAITRLGTDIANGIRDYEDVFKFPLKLLERPEIVPLPDTRTGKFTDAQVNFIDFKESKMDPKLDGAIALNLRLNQLGSYLIEASNTPDPSLAPIMTAVRQLSKEYGFDKLPAISSTWKVQNADKIEELLFSRSSQVNLYSSPRALKLVEITEGAQSAAEQMAKRQSQKDAAQSVYARTDFERRIRDASNNPIALIQTINSIRSEFGNQAFVDGLNSLKESKPEIHSKFWGAVSSLFTPPNIPLSAGEDDLRIAALTAGSAEDYAALASNIVRRASLKNPAEALRLTKAASDAGIPVLAFDSERAWDGLIRGFEGSIGLPVNSLINPISSDATDSYLEYLIKSPDYGTKAPFRFPFSFPDAASQVVQDWQKDVESWRSKRSQLSDALNRPSDALLRDVPLLAQAYIRVAGGAPPTIWNSWSRMLSQQPIVAAQFGTQLLQTYDSLTGGLRDSQRAEIEAVSAGLGLASTVEILFKSTGLGVSLGFTTGVGAAALALSFLGGIYLSKQGQRRKRSEYEARQREAEAERAQIEAERKKLEADRQDRQSVENVLRARQTFFQNIQRQPEILRSLSGFRPEYIENFVRRPQYASFVGLARSLERESAKLLKPRF